MEGKEVVCLFKFLVIRAIRKATSDGGDRNNGCSLYWPLKQMKRHDPDPWRIRSLLSKPEPGNAGQILHDYLMGLENGGCYTKYWGLKPCHTLWPHDLSMEFSRQEYWSGLPFPSPGDLSDTGMEPGSTTFQADFFFTVLATRVLSLGLQRVGHDWATFNFTSYQRIPTLDTEINQNLPDSLLSNPLILQILTGFQNSKIVDCDDSCWPNYCFHGGN